MGLFINLLLCYIAFNLLIFQRINLWNGGLVYILTDIFLSLPERRIQNLIWGQVTTLQIHSEYCNKLKTWYLFSFPINFFLLRVSWKRFQPVYSVIDTPVPLLNTPLFPAGGGGGYFYCPPHWIRPYSLLDHFVKRHDSSLNIWFRFNSILWSWIQFSTQLYI